ncbi:type VI secretion system protein TssA, partial [Burkholderia sp. Ac-20379]|uniref:type VI secretion system protein TssA n=1 Tax=Burkholderia sp. Ac-20379 TaxID=2703900 RepID=UPI001D6AD1EB|nr:type VI secretion system protein TssA [Burkholderia sp. Ac-20379]
LGVDIDELRKFVDAQLARRFPELATAGGTPDATDATDATGTPGSDGEAAPAAAARPDTIASQADVIRRLDELCEYYERAEPSSPLPVLLKRARRLVGKSFAEVLEDIAPGGMSELRTLAGPNPD